MLRTIEDDQVTGTYRLDELVHEVRGSVAGIAAATRILHGGENRPCGVAGRRLEHLLETELCRLERLLGARATDHVTEEPLADLVDDVVLSHRIRRRDVRWNEADGGLVRHGSEVREVLHTLLDNAARHAHGAGVTVDVRRHAGWVEVVVSDEGPGVPAELAPSVFDRGVRGAGSAGEGLGLYLARRLLVDLGGMLRLDPSTRGATFVMVLPSAQQRAA